MRRRGPVLAAVVLAGLLLPGTAVVAQEAEHQEHGWWWRAQTGALDLPPPPFVPEGGLAVGQDVDGPTAVSALRFGLPEDDVVAATLVLEVEDEQGGEVAAIRACRAAGSWSAAEAGVWDERPEGDCEAGHVSGTRDEESEVWEFELDLLVEDGVLDVVLLPDAQDDGADEGEQAPLPAGTSTAQEEEEEEQGGAPFQVSFAPPDDESLEVSGGVGGFDGGGFEDGGFEGAEDGGDGAGGQETTGGAATSGPDPSEEVAEPGGFGTAPAPSSDPEGADDGEAGRAPAPEIAGADAEDRDTADDGATLAPPDGSARGGDEEVVAAPVGVGGPRARQVAGLVSLVSLLAAALLFLSDRGASLAGIPGLRRSRIVRPEVASSRLPSLAPQGRGAQAAVGGIGRFVRPREGDPPSL